jgi:Uma2 family endonuclease
VKAVLLEVSPAELARRKRRARTAGTRCGRGSFTCHRRRRGSLVAGINVFRADNDYRIPGLTFISRGHENVLAEDGARNGPDLVIEIRSPGDESFEKLPFYAALGVREVVIILRDEKTSELFRLAGDRYVAVSADVRGMPSSGVLGVRFGHRAATPPRLVLEDSADPATRTET